MKTAKIFPCLMLVCSLFLLSSCSAYQLAEWSHDGSATLPSGAGDNHPGSYCQHRPNRPSFVGSMSGTSIYAMQGEYYPFCRKCRQ